MNDTLVAHKKLTKRKDSEAELPLVSLESIHLTTYMIKPIGDYSNKVVEKP